MDAIAAAHGGENEEAELPKQARSKAGASEREKPPMKSFSVWIASARSRAVENWPVLVRGSRPRLHASASHFWKPASISNLPSEPSRAFCSPREPLSSYSFLSSSKSRFRASSNYTSLAARHVNCFQDKRVPNLELRNEKRFGAPAVCLRKNPRRSPSPSLYFADLRARPGADQIIVFRSEAL